MRWIDPPSGWKYGFPRPYDPVLGQSIDEWLLANGYPQSEIDQWLGDGPPVAFGVGLKRTGHLSKAETTVLACSPFVERLDGRAEISIVFAH
jgi:hypothetical protein